MGPSQQWTSEGKVNSWNKETPKYSGLNYLEFHSSLIEHSRADGTALLSLTLGSKRAVPIPVTSQPKGQSEGREQGSTPSPSQGKTQKHTFHFCLHPIGWNLVTGSDRIAKEAGKCNHVSSYNYISMENGKNGWEVGATQSATSTQNCALGLWHLLLPLLTSEQPLVNVGEMNERMRFRERALSESA